MPVTQSTFLTALEVRQERVGAVVLAGGLARRMAGQDKGLIELQNKPMTAWVLDVVRPEVHDVFINANRNEEYYKRLNAAVIADVHTGHIGPLAGLSSALHHCPNPYMFMCPCDSPFISSDLVSTLGNACIEQDADIAVAHDGERMQPVFCLVNRRCLSSLDDYLDSGERKIDRWYATQHTVEVDCASLSDSFRNINTEEERSAAEQALFA